MLCELGRLPERAATLARPTLNMWNATTTTAAVTATTHSRRAPRAAVSPTAQLQTHTANVEQNVHITFLAGVVKVHV